MRYLLIALTVLVFGAGCKYGYFNKREKWKVHAARTAAVVQDQLTQWRLHNSSLFSNGRTVTIRPLMCNNSGTGLYAYNPAMIHFGYIHYFIYNNDSVVRISRTNEDSLCMTVNQFLAEN